MSSWGLKLQKAGQGRLPWEGNSDSLDHWSHSSLSSRGCYILHGPTGFGKWDVSRRDTSKSLKYMQTLACLCFGHSQRELLNKRAAPQPRPQLRCKEENPQVEAKPTSPSG